MSNAIYQEFSRWFDDLIYYANGWSFIIDPANLTPMRWNSLVGFQCQRTGAEFWLDTTRIDMEKRDSPFIDRMKFALMSDDGLRALGLYVSDRLKEVEPPYRIEFEIDETLDENESADSEESETNSSFDHLSANQKAANLITEAISGWEAESFDLAPRGRLDLTLKMTDSSGGVKRKTVRFGSNDCGLWFESAIERSRNGDMIFDDANAMLDDIQNHVAHWREKKKKASILIHDDPRSLMIGFECERTGRIWKFPLKALKTIPSDLVRFFQTPEGRIQVADALSRDDLFSLYFEDDSDGDCSPWINPGASRRLSPPCYAIP